MPAEGGRKAKGFIGLCNCKVQRSGWTASRDPISNTRTWSSFIPRCRPSLRWGNCFLSQALSKWVTWQVDHQNAFQLLLPATQLKTWLSHISSKNIQGIGPQELLFRVELCAQRERGSDSLRPGHVGYAELNSQERPVCLFPTPHPMISPWKRELGPGGTVYPVDTGKCCKPRLFFLGELVVKYSPVPQLVTWPFLEPENGGQTQGLRMGKGWVPKGQLGCCGWKNEYWAMSSTLCVLYYHIASYHIL